MRRALEAVGKTAFSPLSPFDRLRAPPSIPSPQPLSQSGALSLSKGERGFYQQLLNASPLSASFRSGQAELLPRLFQQVYVPVEVLGKNLENLP